MPHIRLRDRRRHSLLPGSRVGSVAEFNSTVRTAASALTERWSPKARVTTTAPSPKSRTQHSAPTAQLNKADVKWWSEKGYPAPTPAPPPKPLPLASLRCYALRYTDLLAGFCGGKGGKGGKIGSCDWAALLAHWEGHGPAEGRVFECTSAPSPPLLPPSPSPVASLSPSPSLPTRIASSSPPPQHDSLVWSLAHADGAHPPSPPASLQDKSARKRKAFTTYVLPLLGVIAVAYAGARFAHGCRAAFARRAASTPSRRPRRSQYKKAADADAEDDEPRGKFSTVDLDDTLSQAYDFD